MPTNEFGYTPWGADLVRIAEPIATREPNRWAPRARSIARNNGVDLTVDGRLVKAVVHRGADASVAHIEFGQMPPATARAVGELIGSAGEPDEEVHRNATGSGHHPGPVIDNCDCSCTARSTMCVHVLATLYALAAAIDLDPRIALRLQDFGDRPGAALEDDAVIPQWIPLTAFDSRSYYG
ncbi:hypothetical protein [Gordonia sp. SL306]|uniref:hypothetical protein n=1 Tax=Gordonia sp. SL306 TaxID=2995145 RepID=UPI00226FB3C3|nr:hypothetical protein [Gordonia sp. SL306]WAC55742.1 hypothetical protein OVA31_00190 [Gordonia sp. SL306]